MSKAISEKTMSDHDGATKHAVIGVPLEARPLAGSSRRGGRHIAQGETGVALAMLLLSLVNASARAALSDQELIGRALTAARAVKLGAPTDGEMRRHCLERALTFSVPVPPLGKSENLNEVVIERKRLLTVSFLHMGSAYDGYDCTVAVELSRAGVVKKVTSSIRPPRA